MALNINMIGDLLKIESLTLQQKDMQRTWEYLVTLDISSMKIQ